MAEELSVADIQQSAFEHRAYFKELFVGLLETPHQAELVKAVYNALSPWHVPIENFSGNAMARNVGEVQLNVSAPTLLSSIQVNISGVTMTAFNVAWSNAKHMVAFFQAALDAIRISARQDFESQLVTLAFHVKPGPKSFKEILRQFVNVRALDGENANMYGVSVYSRDFTLVIDNSAVIPGAAFVKLFRSFTPDKRLEEIAVMLYKDEETVLRRLGFKLQQ
jgi:hypothetical protein